MFLRTAILPQVKSLLGPSLKAIILTGSAQLGVRLATRKRAGSDLDVIVAFDVGKFGSERVSDYSQEVWNRLLARLSGLARKNGIRLNMRGMDADWFAEEQKAQGEWGWAGHPFQIIHGAEWVGKKFGKRYLKAMKNNRAPQSYAAMNPEKNYLT